MNDAARRLSTLAVVSLVAGLAGWTIAPWIGSLVAIVTGHMARSELRRDPQGLEGNGFAVAGLVLGYAMIVLSLLSILAIVLFFGGLAAFIAFIAAFGY